MCSLNFSESSGRTGVTARRWHLALTTVFLQRSVPLILIGYLRRRRRNKSSSPCLNCIDWLSVSSLPPLHPAPPTPFLPTVHLSVKCHVSAAGQSSSAGTPEARPPPALWLDRCDKKGRLLLWKPAKVQWRPPPLWCLPNQLLLVRTVQWACHALSLFFKWRVAGGVS